MKVIKLLKKYKENYKHSPLLQNKIESEYISLIYLKDLKKLKIENTSKDKIDYPKLKTKYKKYMVLMRLFDKEIINKKKEIVEVGKIITNVNYNKYKENYMNNKYNHKDSRMVNIFKNLEVMLNKKSRISKVENYKIQNIVEDHSNYINNKKISNNLLRPYYFFPAGYIEGPKPTQIRQ